MHLTMDLTRVVARRAMLGRTWAGDRVFDSPANPADIRTAGRNQPFIAVYVDESDFDPGDIEMGGWLTNEGVTRLAIECGSISAVDREGNPVDSDDAPGTGDYQLDPTDQGQELTIGFISRQAMACLFSVAEVNPWADLFRRIIESKVRSVKIRRGGPPGDQMKTKGRYASRVTILELGAMLEPPRGSAVNEDSYAIWHDALTMMDADDELKPIAGIFRAHIEHDTGPLEDWRLQQKLMMLPTETMDLVGIRPRPQPDEHPTELAEVKLNSDVERGDEEVIP